MRKPDILIAREIAFFNPVRAFHGLADKAYAQLLHSVPGAAGGGRYSYIACDPFNTIVAKDGMIAVGGESRSGNPFSVLQATLRSYAQPTQPELPPFQGGAVGYFGYELVHHLERIRPHTRDDLGIPEMAIGLYDVVAAFDWQDRRAWIISTGLPETIPERRRARARARADELQAKLMDRSPPDRTLQGEWVLHSNRSKSEYLRAVRRAIDHVYEGDIYQANVSQRFETGLGSETSVFALFEKMIEASPVSFAAFLNLPGATVISTSPERFVKVSDPQGARHVETRPIKGTAGRGRSAQEDQRFRRSLMKSEKDRAENVMIVDLLRNDLSKVCDDASVRVAELCAAESYAAVHHLVSTVTGTLRPDMDAVDLLKACFPGGSITGAPKVRAMEIIAELEGVSRGPYCGAIGYLGFDGAMDTSIAIRTLSVIGDGSERRAVFPVGGGIVADSNPEDEYDESLLKAKAFFDALSNAGVSP